MKRSLHLMLFVVLLTPFICNSSGASENTSFPDSQTIRVKNKAIHLEGSLYFADAQHQADSVFVIVGGSGAKTREDTRPAVGLFQTYNSDIFIYDRRGNGQSTDGQNLTAYAIPDTLNSDRLIPLLASDVAAIAKKLKSEEFGYKKVIVTGSSMGAWVAVRAASNHPDVIDAVISFSGAASSVGVSDYYNHLTNSGKTADEAYSLLSSYNGPQGYEPSIDILNLRSPALWILGEKDMSNPTFADLAIINKIKSNTEKDFSVSIVANADHDLKNVKTQQMEMGWVDTLGHWLNQKLNTQP